MLKQIEAQCHAMAVNAMEWAKPMRRPSSHVIRELADRIIAARTESYRGFPPKCATCADWRHTADRCPGIAAGFSSHGFRIGYE